MRRILYRGGKGIGDALFVTAIARALAESGRPAWVSTSYPELWFNNPDIRGFLPPAFVRHLSRWLPALAVPMVYENPSPHDPMHVMGRLALRAGLSPDSVERPRIYLTVQESEWGRDIAQGKIIIQSDAKTEWTPNKNWFPDRFQAVARACGELAPVIQVGALSGPSLAGASDWRGRTSVRQAAALLANARLFIGLEGGLMHMARAVKTPSIIIFGGYVSPEQTGYRENINFYSPVECAPCWKREPCPYQLKCMNVISAGDVIEAVHRLWRQIQNTPQVVRV